MSWRDRLLDWLDQIDMDRLATIPVERRVQQGRTDWILQGPPRWFLATAIAHDDRMTRYVNDDAARRVLTPDQLDILRNVVKTESPRRQRTIPC